MILGVTYDLVLVLRSQIFEYLRETISKHDLEHRERIVQNNDGKNIFLRKRLTTSTSLESCDLSGHIFGASVSLKCPHKKNWLSHPLPLFMAASMMPNMWHSSDLHAAFVGDKIWGDVLEPARTPHQVRDRLPPHLTFKLSRTRVIPACNPFS